MTVYAAKKLISTYRLVPEFEVFVDEMLMLRAKPSESWLPKVMANLDAVLVDHAHLERKAATSALSLERYQELFDRVADLNAIAIEELEHFQLVLDILADRGVPFSHPISSPWISGLMGTIRKGRHEQVIDHLLCAALIEGRSCEKFKLLAEHPVGETLMATPALSDGVMYLRGTRTLFAVGKPRAQ